jgi:hypothetical protein
MNFGPVSEMAKDSGRAVNQSIFGLIVAVIFMVFGVAQILMSLKRGRDLRALVMRRSWQWIGEDLPHYIRERALLSVDDRQDVEITHAFTGTVQGVEFVCCDCKLGRGKGSKSVTLIAARSDENPFSVNRWDSSYHATSDQGWVALLPDRRHTLPVSLIEALIENIRSGELSKPSQE